jgi:hypothetical protein
LTYAAGNVTFVVTSESGAFPQFDLTMPTKNNRLLLESIEKQLDLRQPPLIVKTVNNVPATARPEDKTLMVEFSNGERLQTVAELAPGKGVTQNECILVLLMRDTAIHYAAYCKLNAHVICRLQMF